MKRFKQNKAITLIALVVTIIILLILAGVAMSLIFGDEGLIERAQKSVFLTEIIGYQTDVEMYVAGEQIENGINTLISVGLTGQESIKTILPGVSSDLEDEVIVQENTMYYLPNDTDTSKKRTQWCIESGIPVWGYTEPDSDPTEKGDKTVPDSEYKKVGNLYMQTPDLSNLNVEATYYVTYDDSGNEQIAGRIDRVDEPSNWYDYENKKWANIVTVTNNQVSYWVWIPKYTYKTDSSTETVDAKFISEEGDVYKDSNGAIVELTDYKVPESFTFANTILSGYWMSKYEVSQN